MNIIQRIIARAIGFPFEQPRGSPEWVGATVRSSDIVAGRSIGTGPGGAFVARATQYVLTCATLNARNCAAIPLRLVRRKSATRVSPFGSAPSSPFKSARARERRRKFYTDPRMVGRKAADYAAYGDDIEEVPEHDVIDLLQRPNPYMTGTDMDELAYLTLELCGNAYEYVHGEGEPQEIYPMRAPYVRVIPSEDGFVAGYQYARDTSDPMIVGREMVMHYQHTPNPADPFYGIGPLHSVQVEADIAQAAALSEHYRWQNGSRPDYAVKITSPANPTQIEQIRAEVSRWHRGIKKTGTPAVMANAEIVDLGFAPKDMEYLNGIKVSNEAIWNAFGVPQSLLNLNDANLASSTTGHGQYNRQTIMPRVAKRAMYLTEFLLPRYGINPGEMWFAPDNPEGDDDVMDAERLTKLVQAGVMTVNEARSELGLPPVDEPGASELGSSKPSNPFGGAGGSSPFAGLMSPFGKNAAPVAGNARLTDGRGKRNPDGSCKGHAEQPVPVAGRGGGLQRHGDACAAERSVRDDPDHKVPLQISDNLKFYGRFGERLAHKALMHGEPEELAKIRAEFEDELTDWFRKFIKQVVESEGVGVALAASDVAALSDKLDEMAREYIARMSKVGLNDAAAALSLGFDVKPLSSLVFLETYVPKLVDAVTSDTAVAVRDAIAAGMNEGMTIPQITGEIQKEIPVIAQYRAERIARTEASHAYTRGRVDTWKQAGIEKKVWLLGGNPCQVCLDIAAANPDPIPMDRPFYTGDFFGTGNSPAHPNCTCTVAPVLSDEQGEST